MKVPSWEIEEGAPSGQPSESIYDIICALVLANLLMGRMTSLTDVRAALGHEKGNNAAGTAIGQGVNGRGCKFWRDRSRHNIAVCRENGKLAIQRMTEEAVVKFCDRNSLSLEELVAKVDSLPTR